MGHETMMMCITLSLALIFLAIAIPVRTLWVFNWRTKLNRFENGEHVIDGYVDYDTMMMRFWVWDIDKLKAPNNEFTDAPPTGGEDGKSD